jgi:TruB family pseudouridylate synthase (N terminal domain)
MNQSKLHAYGFQKNRRQLRYFGTRSTLSTIALRVAITMLMYTKYASSFTPLLHACVSTSPVARATNIIFLANRITSQGNVRHRSNRSRLRQSPTDTDVDSALPPVLAVEGLFAVDKPLEWTSQDVVSFIRGMFERDARSRGANPGKIGSRKNKNLQVVRCGHGGTLDPLASGVLVIGLGSGTKLLQG